MMWRIATAGVALAVLIALGLANPDLALDRRAEAHGGHAFAAGEPGDPRKPFRVVDMTMSDGPGTMTYTPNKIDVKRGEQIKFVLKNTGYLAHEFLLDSFENNAKHKLEMEKNPEMAHDDPNGKRVEPKNAAEVLWRFTKAGTFEFACLIPGHYETGMKGVVIVK